LAALYLMILIQYERSINSTIRVVLGATKLIPVSKGSVTFVVGNESITFQDNPHPEYPDLVDYLLAIIQLPYPLNRTGEQLDSMIKSHGRKISKLMLMATCSKGRCMSN
jgi:hypothetical protein